MSNPVVRLMGAEAHDGRKIGRRLWLMCPGCEELHSPAVIGEDGDLPEGPCWDWDGVLEPLTISPSLLVTGGPENSVCHSFIRAGQWEFLSDCTHPLAGQIVPMVPLPDWLARPMED